jgi:hypothetical protein
MMNHPQFPLSANNAETPDPVEKPVALADEQLDRVAAGLAPAVSIKPADLQQAVCCAVDVATALNPKKIPVPITMGLIAPLPSS